MLRDRSFNPVAGAGGGAGGGASGRDQSSADVSIGIFRQGTLAFVIIVFIVC